MEIFILILLLLLILGYTIFKYYEPNIDIVTCNKHYEIFLEYNVWKDNQYLGRRRTRLFEFNSRF